MLADFKQTLVAGASNQVGYFLLPRLQAAGHSVIALSRQVPRESSTGIDWQQCDLRTETPHVNQACNLIFVAPLTLLVPLLQRLGNNVQRVIAFSSTSRFTKAASDSAVERAVAQQLADAEQAALEYCAQQQIPCTLFRPTLIYGCGRDKNVSFIVRFIQRFGFFPLLGQGQGLRQPVHADDLAQACVSALANPRTFDRIYNLSGGETLSYRAMLEVIFQRLHRSPRIVVLPAALFAFSIRLLKALPSFSHLTPAMANRMNQDLCFDHQSAVDDFQYQPRAFSHSDLGFNSDMRPS